MYNRPPFCQNKNGFWFSTSSKLKMKVTVCFCKKISSSTYFLPGVAWLPSVSGWSRWSLQSKINQILFKSNSLGNQKTVNKNKSKPGLIKKRNLNTYNQSKVPTTTFVSFASRKTLFQNKSEILLWKIPCSKAKYKTPNKNSMKKL